MVVVGMFASVSMAVLFTMSGRKTRGIAQTTIVTMEGAMLPAVFDGLSSDPHYDLQSMAGHKTTVIRCPDGASTTLLDRIKKFLDPSAFASGTCPDTALRGQIQRGQYPQLY